METPREVLIALARRYAFGDVAALASQGLVPDHAAPAIAALCSFGQRVLDLDAEDFGMPETIGDSSAIPRRLMNRARASRMPQTPREQPRGALLTLRPAYALLLEVIEVRWLRHDLAALVAAVHIAGEYLPMLAWESVLGHAADPVALGASVGRPGSRFGVAPDLGGPRACHHTRTERSAAERALRVAAESAQSWRHYLDRHHSAVSAALGACAAECRTPCPVVTGLADRVRADLAGRCRLALDFAQGGLVRLRHAAPVGHGFGVPSREEVLDAWTRTRASLGHREPGLTALAGADDDGYPLPGLPAVFSAVAGAPIIPDTLLYDVAAHVAGLLDQIPA
ncbi:hypothetical protein ACRYCC_40940 [Actinomadura scrupuli]|uniref:hypothetical protein n=1 Tax=Actinomadura scrupuli TaxID=559629 RepID=UPI003D99CD8F